MSVTPESLFVVTFTDKAARELTTRISNRLSELGIKFNLNEKGANIVYWGTPRHIGAAEEEPRAAGAARMAVGA
mgnify:CR=1 FL=1